MKNKKGSMIGVSLIFVVFVLLCLVTFGTLSLMLSKKDIALSTSITENIINYYDADITAQEKLQEIDLQLQDTYSQVDNIDDYESALLEALDEDIIIFQENGSLYLTFTTAVSDMEQLNSKLCVSYPCSDTYYSIVVWTLEHIG